MKRLRRLAFSSLTCVSFFLCLLSIAMWPASHWRSLLLSCDRLGGDLRHDSENTLSVAAIGGLTIISFSRSVLPTTIQAAQRRQQFGAESRPISFHAEWEAPDPPFGPSPVDHSVLGFGYQADQAAGGTDELYDQDTAEGPATVSDQFLALQLPLWFWAIVLGVLPFFWARRNLQSYRRRKLGLCCRCAYDVRATPQACPECGTQWPLNARPAGSMP
jgi:hypothetical protein